MDHGFILWSSFLPKLVFISINICIAISLYFLKSTIQPHMEYCCHVWVGAPSCYLEISDRLQERVCRTIGPTLAASLKPLGNQRNVGNLYLFYRYFFHSCSSELAEWFRFLILVWGPLIMIDCMILLSLFLDVTRIYFSTLSFLAQLDSGILYAFLR